MAAYLIGIRHSVTDAESLKEYSRRSPEARRPGTKPLALYGQHKVLEGEPIDGAVIVEFPSYDEALAWYTSPKYEDIKFNRLKGGTFTMIIVDGLPS